MKLRTFYDFGHWPSAAMSETTALTMLPQQGGLQFQSTEEDGTLPSPSPKGWVVSPSGPDDLGMLRYYHEGNNATGGRGGAYGRFSLDLLDGITDAPPRVTVVQCFVSVLYIAGQVDRSAIGIGPLFDVAQARSLQMTHFGRTDIFHVMFVVDRSSLSVTAYLDGTEVKSWTTTEQYLRYFNFHSKIASGTTGQISARDRTIGGIAIWDRWTEDDPFYLPPVMLSRTVPVDSVVQGDWPATNADGTLTLEETLINHVTTPNVSTAHQYANGLVDEGTNGPLNVRMDWPALGAQGLVAGMRLDVRNGMGNFSDTQLLVKWNDQEIHRAPPFTEGLRTDNCYVGSTMPDGLPISLQRLQGSVVQLEYVNTELPDD